MTNFVQIGLAILRDPVTGEPQKERIPIYAKSKTAVQESGFTRCEEKIIDNVSGVYVNIFRKYLQELKKIEENR